MKAKHYILRRDGSKEVISAMSYTRLTNMVSIFVERASREDNSLCYRRFLWLVLFKLYREMYWREKYQEPICGSIHYGSVFTLNYFQWDFAYNLDYALDPIFGNGGEK